MYKKDAMLYFHTRKEIHKLNSENNTVDEKENEKIADALVLKVQYLGIWAKGAAIGDVLLLIAECQHLAV
jgi:hypothetical protein